MTKAVNDYFLFETGDGTSKELENGRDVVIKGSQ